MIDLKKVACEKQYLTFEKIYAHVGPLTIFRRYIDEDFTIGRAFSSPLRDDRVPSFGIYPFKNGYRYNDFVKGGGDAIKFVKELFNYDSWYDAMSQIARDFGFDDQYAVRTNIKKSDNTQLSNVKIRSKPVKIKVKTKNWTSRDMEYWRDYGISLDTLIKYRVYPISYVFLLYDDPKKEMIIPADTYAYCFMEYKDEHRTFKIYQPFSKYKWMSNHDFSVWQGWSQLPSKGKDLIITKSLKDVMSIVENTAFPAVSLQHESSNAKENVVDQLKQRFDNIYVLYDNDFDKHRNWGQIFGKTFAEKHGLVNIKFDDMYKAKDFSDFVKKYDYLQANKLLTKLINNHKNETIRKES